jgi:hypothetical protein
MRRKIALILILALIASSIAVVGNSFAQAAPKPLAPTFTATVVDRSYDEPASSTIDPYTGETINHPAHRVLNYTIDLVIKNQPFTPTEVQGGSRETEFVYNIQAKGHYSNDWIRLYVWGEGPKQADSEYTKISYLLTIYPSAPDKFNLQSDDWRGNINSIYGIPQDTQLDFQVEALVGYGTRTIEFNSQHFEVVESATSNTQTVKLPIIVVNNTASPPPTQTQAMPTINNGAQPPVFQGLTIGEATIIIILSIIAVLLVVLIVVLRKKKANQEKSVAYAAFSRNEFSFPKKTKL